MNEDAQAEEREAREQNASSEAIQSREKKKIQELQNLCTRFGIDPDNLDALTDKQLFQSFIFGDPKSFYTYKNFADLDRTLIKNNLKPKRIDAREMKTLEVFRMNKLEK